MDNVKDQGNPKKRYLQAPIIAKKEKTILGKLSHINYYEVASSNVSFEPIGSSKENLNVQSNSKAKLVKSEPKCTTSILKKTKTEPAESIENKLASTKISQLTAVELPYENIDTETDEFNCPDYAEAIFEYYRARDKKFKIGDYIKEQPHINKQMRLLLVDWMVEVQQQLEFNHEILYLSVKLLDLYLNSKLIEKEKLQLLGGAAMLCACKFEVCWIYIYIYIYYQI